MAYWRTQPECQILPPDPKWQPVYWTEMKNNVTLGDDVCDFIEKFVTPPRLYTENWEVLAWQRWLLRIMFELDSFGFLRYKEFYFQIPRKNGKSFLASSILLYFLASAEDGDQFLTVATSAKQARIVYEEVMKNVSRSSILSRILKVQENIIRHKAATAWLAPLSFSSGGAQGFAPKISIADEAHAMDGVSGDGKRGKAMHAALTKGSKDRPESMHIMITTAGSNLQGFAYEQYEYAKAVATGQVDDPTYGVAIWEAEDADDIYEPSSWRKANPNLAIGLMSEEDFKNDLIKAEATGTADFERYHLNKWIKFNDKEQFINAFYFEQAAVKGTIPLGSKIAVGFDGAQHDDATVFMGIDIETGLMEPLWWKEKPKGETQYFITEDEVREAMDWIMERYDVAMVYLDPAKYQSVIVGWMQKYGYGIIRDIPQSNIRLAPLCDSFREELYSKKITHTNHPLVRNHFMNAVENLYGVPKKESAKSENKIDALAAAILAAGARREYLETSEIQREYERQRWGK